MDKGLVANGNVLSREIVVKNQVVETNYLERDIRGLVGFSPVDVWTVVTVIAKNVNYCEGLYEV